MRRERELLSCRSTFKFRLSIFAGVYDMNNVASIILAAGEGTRMKSAFPKVLHPICGKPMIKYLIDTIRSVGIRNIIVVVGHKADLVKKSLGGVKYVAQRKLLGTADAVLKTKNILAKDNKIDSVLISYAVFCLKKYSARNAPK